jgi:hypothetical protein
MAPIVHQMAGFDVEKTRKEFSIPPDHEPVAVVAIGYSGNLAGLSEKLRKKAPVRENESR